MSLRNCALFTSVILILFTCLSLSTAAEIVAEDIKVAKSQDDLPVKKGNTATTDNKGTTTGPKSPKTIACIEEDTECNKDKLGYEAITHLHRLIDDDHNGNVDQSESDEFLRDELQYTDGFERHSLFHNNDKLISVDDLWKAWKFSEVYNWTVDDVVDWLRTEVDLPQYTVIFMDNSVTGSFLPRLASSNTFMTTILGIKNPVHKQKLSLKAMDTVLFGAPPKRHSYMKDLMLVASLILAFGGCWFAAQHYRYSQAQVRKMAFDLEALQKAEDALTEVQRKLEDAESRQMLAVPRPVSDFKEGTAVLHADMPHNNGGEGTQQIREELAATLIALQQAETQLENSWTPPGELQALLQLTHELEQLHYNTKRQAAERQFQSAKEVCDKIKRRNKAFFGSLRMAHSNSLDEIDQRILDARIALEEVKQDLQERLQRWHNIERLCGFPVISNPGLSTLHQILYGTKDGASGGKPSVAVGQGSMEEMEEEAHQADSDSLSTLHNSLIPEMKAVDSETSSCYNRGGLRRQPRLSYPSLPNVPSRPFLRQRGINDSTGSLSQVPRTGISAKAAFTTAPLHPALSVTHRGSTDNFLSSALIKSDSTHHFEQHQDPASALSYSNHQNLSPGTISSNFERGRSTSLTPSNVSSVHSNTPSSSSHLQPSAYHGYAGMTSASHSVPVTFSLSRSSEVDICDDNLSQATLDSLQQNQLPSVSHDRQHNGLDLVSHTQQQHVSTDGLALNPHPLQKKPSKRKKLLSMFKKSGKDKAT